MDLLQESLKYIMEGNTDVNDVNFVCSGKALIYIMLSYYYSDDFVIEAVKFKNTIYLGFRQDNMVAPPNDEPCSSYIAPPKNIGGFKIIFSVELNGIDGDVNSLEDVDEPIIEFKRIVDSTDNSLMRRMHLKWLIESDLVGVIDMIHVEKYYLNQKVSEKPYSIQFLQEEANYNGLSLSDCYTYLGHFLKQVAENMREVVDPKKVFSYKFQRRSTVVNYIPIAFEVSERDILQPPYINYVNNFDNN